MTSQQLADTDRIYYSKRDTWIVLLLWGITLFAAGSAIYITFLDLRVLSLISQEIFFLIIVAISLSILRSTYYVIQKEGLFIRTGPFRWTIPYNDIRRVTPERNLWSSAALSIDRLHITHGQSKKGSYISPKDEQAFMRDLAERSPSLVIKDNEVVHVGDMDKNGE